MSGSIAVVTGAGSGIGRCCAERIASHGLHVIVAGRTAATLDDVIGAIRTAGGDGTAVIADCATEAGRGELVAATAAMQRPVTAFVIGAPARRTCRPSPGPAGR